MEKNARFSETVKGQVRTYFFDLRHSEKGNPYLLITESRKSKEKEGEFDRDRIMVFPADFDSFADALNNAIQHQKEKTEASAG